VGGFFHDPVKWGWKNAGGQLTPIIMESNIVPSFILKMIYCNCQTNCQKNYCCKKANVLCSNLCGFRYGNFRENSPELSQEPDSDDEKN
jgi:hypothetical protein